MAQGQEEGWPLGLRPARSRGVSGSISFSTLITSSPSSSTASSDLDTESTGSFFHDKSITLGSLIGVSSFLEHPRRSSRVKSRSESSSRSKKSCAVKSGGAWLLSLCSKINNANNNAPSLGHFLEVERRASVQSPSSYYDPNDNEFNGCEPNLLFINGHVAPPHSSPEWFRGGKGNRSLTHFNEVGVPVLCSCMCGRRTN